MLSAMTRKIRRVLFFLAFLLFLGASYVAVLYVQGYKYSFPDNKFTLTGAIYLSANTESDFYLNGKHIGGTSFLTNSVNEDGLLPGNYLIEIVKNNYSSWKKEIFVSEGQVVDFPKIIILPVAGDNRDQIVKEINKLLYPELANILPLPSPNLQPTPFLEDLNFYINSGILYDNRGRQPEILAANTRGYSISKNSKRLLWWTKYELWAIWISDSDYQPFAKAGEKEIIYTSPARIKKAEWFRDDNHIALDSGSFKVIEGDTRGGINIVEPN